MKPDILLFSDLHLNDWNDFNKIDPKTGLGSRLLEGLNVLDQIITLSEKRGVKWIVCLGDVFDRKDQLPNHLLVEFKKRIDSSGIPFTVLMGNHDYNLPNYPLLQIFDGNRFLFINEFDNIRRGNAQISMIPFQRNWKDFEELWEEAHRDKPDIICFHNIIPGAIYDNGKKVEGEWKLKTKKSILYLAGDLHRAQAVGGIRYLGSPYQFTWRDAGIDKFVWLLDSQNLAMEAVRLNYPKFIEWDANTGHLSGKDIEGNYIKVIGTFEIPLDKEEVKKMLLPFKPKGIVFNVTTHVARQVRISEEQAKDDLQIIKKYASENYGDLDEKEVAKTGEELWK